MLGEMISFGRPKLNYLFYGLPFLIDPYIKNCDETRPAVMIILGPKPAKSPLKPASLASTMRRCDMEPVGPCPLLICERSVSAG